MRAPLLINLAAASVTCSSALSAARYDAIDLHQRLDNARDHDGFCQEPGGRDE